MALITCPECGRQVSSHADVCPQCGYPINKKQQNAAPENNNFYIQRERVDNKPQIIMREQPGCFHYVGQGCFIAIIVVVVLLILAGIA